MSSNVYMEKKIKLVDVLGGGEQDPAEPGGLREHPRHGDRVRDPEEGEDGDGGDRVLEGEEGVALEHRHRAALQVNQDACDVAKTSGRVQSSQRGEGEQRKLLPRDGDV